ncbi:CopG family ribbon-helix-helix protein [Rhizobium rhizogenes]|uniref:CopG family ribbon-helix-helix protein n=1 Tax=Rhizobium rhizogenes TaxID=359 RepID=UPI0015737CD8|nr:ribbon-helix-helix protein, CopG family [Rhizobium rhizogenes]NTG64728.1 ribbon-helix-helix protein, CopG family [Rhizobium rhizogenes]NTH68453.1 ribbon-helix-helix protein, CopG family [Rhizobium rhizogenes]NTH99930.1 ribbon-helix-helix protein, CopG family [Rhizobium rhizogenes]NTI39082.1 ribbon-helix-helix protein, CopG family [Rhizobium rhizogenes]NTJ18222.1 ribbon-helix-helix protein, CopG family [Rhizobium rhizogenes]
MTDSATITIRVPVEVKDKLESISQETRRSRSYLASEALSEYVHRHFEIKAGLKAGEEDVAAGNITTHVEAMKEIRAVAEAGFSYMESLSFKGWSRKVLDDFKSEFAGMLHGRRVDRESLSTKEND